jgi:flavin reductase (DIM6/NTAB) family NADH-FMN oxidoreductase RutF
MNIEKSNQSGFDSRAYRDALGCFGTGVCLVAADDANGNPRAITVNSFSSVSLHPPIILWSIDSQSDRYNLFTESELFSVNVLPASDAEVSTHFARYVEAELKGEQLARDSNGVPVYTGALAQFVCRTSWRQKAGDHVVIFGDVIGFNSRDGDALGFFRGNYTSHSIPNLK